MELTDAIKFRQQQYFVGYIPDYDPYKTGRRQCCGKCPKQKYTILKK